jgi:hypothetical protein
MRCLLTVKKVVIALRLIISKFFLTNFLKLRVTGVKGVFMAMKVSFFNAAVIASLLFSVSPCEASILTTLDMNAFDTINGVDISLDGHSAEYIWLGLNPEIDHLPYFSPPPLSNEELAYVALDYEQEMQTAAESALIEKTYGQHYTIMTNNPLNSGPGISLGQGSNSVNFTYDLDSNWLFLSVVLYDPNGLLLAYKIITDPGGGTVNLDIPISDSLAGPIAMDFRVGGAINLWEEDPFVSLGIQNLQIIREQNYAPVPVPEPSTIVLFGFGLVGLFFIARKRKKE